MNRRHFVRSVLGSAATLAGVEANHGTARTADRGETLYNGIELPASWPPRRGRLPRDPVLPPYLASPPEVIPIDVGRQLFVDDFLIDQTDLKRTWHLARPHPDNPVLRPDQPWERTGRGPMAMPFSDGVWYDPRDRLFKLWYMGGYGRSTCYAYSEDGLRWTRPKLDVVEGTNVVHAGGRDSTTVWLDPTDPDQRRRFKLWRSHPDGGRWGLSLHVSADGVRWSDRVLRTGLAGDRTTVFYNPFRKVWVYSLRTMSDPRARRYGECKDLFQGPTWQRADEPVWWTGADRLDPPREDLKVTPQLYNLDCVAYESLLLGLFTIWRGDLNKPPGRPKLNEICLGFSRDGFHWHRPQRRAFIGVSEREGDWNWGNVQSAGGGCLVVGDRLFFYHSGRSGTPEKGTTRDTAGSTGLAFLRRDGFASLDAGPGGGSLTTRPVRFSGKHLFVNLLAPTGELRVEVLDEKGQVIPGLARADCVPVRGDHTRQPVAWKKADLEPLANRLVKFRFHLKDGRLFAFWVSRDKQGASRGYIAAGGPGLNGAVDRAGA